MVKTRPLLSLRVVSIDSNGSNGSVIVHCLDLKLKTSETVIIEKRKVSGGDR